MWELVMNPRVPLVIRPAHGYSLGAHVTSLVGVPETAFSSNPSVAPFAELKFSDVVLLAEAAVAWTASALTSPTSRFDTVGSSWWSSWVEGTTDTGPTALVGPIPAALNADIHIALAAQGAQLVLVLEVAQRAR